MPAKDKKKNTISTYTLTSAKIDTALTNARGTSAIAKYNSDFLGSFTSGQDGPYRGENIGNLAKINIIQVTKPHAEDHVMAALFEHINGSCDIAGHLTIKLNKSPCPRCAERLKTFKEKIPKLTIRIKAIGLYLGKDGEGKGLKGLQILQAAGIPLIPWEAEEMANKVKDGTSGTAKGSGFQKGREFDMIKEKDVNWKNYPKTTTHFKGAEGLISSSEQYKSVKDLENARALKFNGLNKQYADLVNQQKELVMQSEKMVEDYENGLYPGIGGGKRYESEAKQLDSRDDKLSLDMKKTKQQLKSMELSENEKKNLLDQLKRECQVKNTKELISFLEEANKV